MQRDSELAKLEKTIVDCGRNYGVLSSLSSRKNWILLKASISPSSGPQKKCLTRQRPVEVLGHVWLVGIRKLECIILLTPQWKWLLQFPFLWLDITEIRGWATK